MSRSASSSTGDDSSGSSATCSTTHASTARRPWWRSGLGTEGDTLLLTVTDRGPGVSPEELPHLFERFHKADPSRSRGGSGLGLAIAREHAELLGGTLDATLRDGGGLRFELRLPVTRPLPGGDEPVTEELEA